MDVSAKVLVTKAIASGFSKNPSHVRECMAQAEAAMNAVAAERGRKIAHAPKLVETSTSAVAPEMVELRFQAATRSI